MQSSLDGSELGEWYDPETFRAASDWSSVTAPPTGIEVLVPEGWSAHASTTGPAVVAIAAPREYADDFSPSITLVVEQPDEAHREIGEYSAAMVAGLRSNMTDAHVIAVDPVWVGGLAGRRAVTGFRNGSRALVAQQYWTVGEEGVATVLTGTSTLEQYLWASDVFAHVAAGLTAATTLPDRAGGQG